jgi:hypothetical protein
MKFCLWFPEMPWNQRLCGAAFNGDSDVFRVQTTDLDGVLDISGAYDNVLIDILCDQMHQAQLAARIVRVMWNLL